MHINMIATIVWHILVEKEEGLMWREDKGDINIFLLLWSRFIRLDLLSGQTGSCLDRLRGFGTWRYQWACKYWISPAGEVWHIKFKRKLKKKLDSCVKNTEVFYSKHGSLCIYAAMRNLIWNWLDCTVLRHVDLSISVCFLSWILSWILSSLGKCLCEKIILHYVDFHFHGTE